MLPNVTQQQQRENDQLFDALWREYGGADPGALILYRDIEAITGRPCDTPEGWALVRRFRRRLLAREENGGREIATRCEPRVGVRLLTHLEAAVDVPQERTRKIYRQGSRTLKETAGAAASGVLSDHQRGILAKTRAAIYAVRRQAGRIRRDHGGGLPPSPTIPARKPR